MPQTAMHLGQGRKETFQVSKATCLPSVFVYPFDAQGKTVRYVGRPAAASPATASLAIHRAETAELLETALAA